MNYLHFIIISNNVNRTQNQHHRKPTRLFANFILSIQPIRKDCLFHCFVSFSNTITLNAIWQLSGCTRWGSLHVSIKERAPKQNRLSFVKRFDMFITWRNRLFLAGTVLNQVKIKCYMLETCYVLIQMLLLIWQMFELNYVFVWTLPFWKFEIQCQF
jgi:hypothetical protein